MKKLVAIIVIVLFVGISISSVVTALDNDTEVNNELIDNSDEFGESSEYVEIITWIKGVFYNWIERKGIFRGEIELYTSRFSWAKIVIRGLRWSNGYIEIYSEDVFGYVHVKHFIGREGFIISNIEGIIWGIKGIALGNIDTS